MSHVPEKQGDTVSFYLRDAMLARVTAMALCLCLSVCLSQVGVPSQWIDESRWFWHVGFFRPILHCGYSDISKIMVLPYGTLFQTPDLPRHIERQNVFSDLARERRTF